MFTFPTHSGVINVINFNRQKFKFQIHEVRSNFIDDALIIILFRFWRWTTHRGQRARERLGGEEGGRGQEFQHVTRWFDSRGRLPFSNGGGGEEEGDFRDISLDCPFRGSLEGNQTYRVVFFNFQEREKKINKIKEKKRKGRCLLVRSMKRIKVFFFFFFFEGHAKRVGEQELGLSFRYRCGKKSMPLYFEWISYFGCTTTARNFCNFLFKFPQLSNFVALRPITTSDVFCEFFRFDFFFFCRMLFRPNVVAVVWILNF